MILLDFCVNAGDVHEDKNSAGGGGPVGTHLCKVKWNPLFLHHSFNARDVRVSFQISFYLTYVTLSLVLR